MSEQNVQTRPLQGKRVLVTRTLEQAHLLSERLQALGASPVEFPTIRIVPPSNWETLDTALGKLFRADAQQQPYYSWLVFTSANGVHICCQRLQSLGFHTQHLTNVRVAAIGPATATALRDYGIRADLVPPEYIAEGVADALLKATRQRSESLVGKRILLPRAAESRKVLVRELQQAGAIVDEIAAYFTLPVASNDAPGRDILYLLQTHQIDIITFTSSSTVRNFVQWLTSCTEVAQNVVTPLVGVRRLVTDNPELIIACIGPITAQTAREQGLTVHIEAKEFTIDGLVEAIVQDEKDSFLRR
jgi:uroporphyrinogen-III synthase